MTFLLDRSASTENWPFSVQRCHLSPNPCSQHSTLSPMSEAGILLVHLLWGEASLCPVGKGSSSAVHRGRRAHTDQFSCALLHPLLCSQRHRHLQVFIDFRFWGVVPGYCRSQAFSSPSPLSQFLFVHLPLSTRMLLTTLSLSYPVLFSLHLWVYAFYIPYHP